MSLVGPRPERPEYAALFARDVARYDDRHRVKSGITGWAQVHGLRGQTSIADRVEWDNYYIANWSLKLDLKILLLTVAELLRFRDSQAERARRKTEALDSAGQALTAQPSPSSASTRASTVAWGHEPRAARRRAAADSRRRRSGSSR